jgi:glutaryl-CoA dehydrogenase
MNWKHVTMTIAETSDFYDVSSMLTEDELDIQSRVREFVETTVVPTINSFWESATMPTPLLDGLRGLGIVGTTIAGNGCPGMSRTAAGIVAQELSRGDGSVNTINAVQSGLVMGSIDRFGSEEQKARWLPALARLDALGAFALTEPSHGSDSVGLETTASLVGDEWVLNGHKRWIGLGSVADIVVIWARDTADNRVKGYVMERGSEGYPEGYRPTVIEGKIAKRAVWQADIVIEDLRIPASHRLPLANSFRDVSALLSSTRTTVAWESVGHAIAAYEIARDYALERQQFGKPIASYQLVQNKLANMLADLTCLRLLVLRASRLQDADRLSNAQASLAKMAAGQKAREICREARDMLGGNGLLLENHVARHLLDMEVVHTYEGTDSIQSLIVGREITGIAAFN